MIDIACWAEGLARILLVGSGSNLDTCHKIHLKCGERRGHDSSRKGNHAVELLAFIGFIFLVSLLGGGSSGGGGCVIKGPATTPKPKVKIYGQGER